MALQLNNFTTEASIEENGDITFWGQIPMKAAWGRIKLYGGKIVENLSQSVAADIMACGGHQAQKAGFRIFALVHDQALAEGDEGRAVDDFVNAMTTLPPWADGLPVDAEGKTTPYYMK